MILTNKIASSYTKYFSLRNEPRNVFAYFYKFSLDIWKTQTRRAFWRFNSQYIKW